VRSIYDASTPFGYFPAKQANEIAVYLNRTDHVERQKQTDSGETKHNGIKFESHRAARGRERLRRQLENGQRIIPYMREQSSDSDQPGPQSVPAQISVPAFFGGRAFTEPSLIRRP